MSFDYSGLLSTATSLISRFGRDVVLRRYSKTLDDPTKPWGPSSTSESDVQAITAKAVFFDSEKDAFTTTGTGVGRGSTAVELKTSRVLVEADSELPEELDLSWKLDDGSRRYDIVTAKPVKPGDTLLYYDLEVRL